MPTIKQYQSSVREERLNAPQISADAFGAAQGRALVNAANMLEGIAGLTDAEMERLSKARVRDLVSKSRAEDRDFMSGIYSKKGVDALTIYEEAKQYFDERKNNLPSELNTRYEKELFGMAYSPLMESHLNGADSHQRQQQELYDKQTRVAAIEQSANDMVTNRNNQEYIDLSLMEIEADAYALNEHLGSEIATAKANEAVSKAKVMLIKAYIADEAVDKAKKYFDANEKHLVGSDGPEVKALLRTASVRKKSQETADSIMDQHEGYKEQLSAARGIKDAEERDAVLQRIKARHQEENQLKEERRKRYMDDMINNILSTTKLDKGGLEKALEYADEAEGADRIQLRKIARDLYSSGAIQTDWALYDSIMALPQKQFLDVDLYEYRSRLSDTEFKSLVSAQRKEKTDGKATTVRTFMSMGNSTLNALGYYEDKEDKNRSAIRNNFFRLFEREIEKQKPETVFEAQKIIDSLIMEIKVTDAGWFAFDAKAPLFTALTPEDIANMPQIVRDANPQYDADLGGWVFIQDGKRKLWKE
jgi:hypothetical protein